MIIDELIYNLSILVALSVLSGFIDARYTRKEIKGKILQGILFGIIAVIGMTFPFVLTEGIIFDGRSIVISLCTLFFGPISGVIAATFAILFRISSEGIGAVTGILVIISSFLIGLYFYTQKNNLDKKTFTTLRLFYFGLLVHFAMIILLLTLPTKNISQTFSIITITVIVVFPLVTVLIGKILLSQEENQKNLEELKESKQQLQFALEGSNEGVWDWNINANEVFFSLRWKQILGFEDQEIGTSVREWETRVHPEDLGNVMTELQKHLRGEIPIYNSEHRVLCKDGSYKWILDRGKVLVKNSDGSPARMVGTQKDITERKDIEKKLQESEERFRKIFENAKIGLYRTTPSGNILMANNELVKMLGYPSFEVLASRNIEKGGFAPSYPRKDFIKTMETNNEVINFESEWVRLDGSTFIVSENAQAIRDSDNNILYYDGVVEDITERKSVEEKIRQKDIQFRKLSVHVPDLIFQFTRRPDGTYHIPIASEGIKNIYGCSPEDVLEDITPIAKVIFSEDTEGLFNEIEYSAKHLTMFTYEFRVQIPGKPIHWLYTKSTPERLGDGSITWYGFNTDITERKQAEQEIIESKEKFKQLFTSLHDGFALHEIILDKNGTPVDYRFLEVNPALENMTGLKTNEIIGRTIRETIPTLDNYWIETYGKVALTGVPIKFENYVPELNKHYRVHAYSPAINKFACITEDITEAKKTEIKINQLSLAVEQSPITVVITDTSGIIEYVNLKFTELTQYTFEEAIGKTPAILKTGNTSPEEYKLMWDTINSGAEWNGNFLNKNKNGELFWESAKISPLRNTEGKITHFIAIKEDISQRVETEKELEEYRNSLELIVVSRTKEIERINKELLSEIKKKQQTEILLHQSLEKEQELNQLKSRFISTASHEFRTPLTSILSSAELIQRYGKKWEEEKYQEHLNRITSSVEYLTELMDDVLTVSKIESGKTQLNPGKINLFEICDKVISDFHLKKGFNHQLLFNYGIKEKEFYLDQKQIQIILQNLLSNAIKYSPDGGKIELTIELHNQEIYFSIADEGLGIPDEDIPHLFEPFYRSLNTENIQGTGLGLSIVKNAVELHGGNISVNSVLGKGTKFLIKIPMTKA